jgi:hypothetical protein
MFFAPSSYLRFDVVYLVLLPFSVLGAFCLAVRCNDRPTLWLLGVPIISVLTLCLVTFGDPRFRHPVDPLAVALASVGFTCLWTFIRISRPEGLNRHR